MERPGFNVDAETSRSMALARKARDPLRKAMIRAEERGDQNGKFVAALAAYEVFTWVIAHLSDPDQRQGAVKQFIEMLPEGVEAMHRDLIRARKDQ